MEVIKEGVRFRLSNFDKKSYQEIVFTHKLPNGEYVEGTTNEEVVSMLIERFYGLQKDQFSCENKVVIELLKTVKRVLNKRLTKKVKHVNSIEEEKKLAEAISKYDTDNDK